MTAAPAVGSRWLLLVHQLPPRPSNLRVHVWRRLRQIGAVSLRNAVYVLPSTPEAREDFAWMREEIAARGGQASILAAEAIDGYTDDELRSAFRTARTRDYEQLIRDVQVLTRRAGARRRSPLAADLRAGTAKVRERLRAIRAADYFGSPRANDAIAAVDALEAALAGPSSSRASSGVLHTGDFTRKVWVTRPHPGIDRMASAWLIRRFIAADATFAFGPTPTARGRIPFDMPDVEFGHHGRECTYETLIRRFGIRDPAAARIGHVVHDLDLKELTFGLPETQTIGRLVEGLREGAVTDDELLRDGIRVIEALYRSYSREGRPQSESLGSGGGRGQADARRRRRKR
jgi:hypothetical protein